MQLKPIHGLILVIILIILPVFGHMDQMPIVYWDESRLATSALEMHRNGNWLIPHYHGLPDMWSTKPPLMIWLQVFSMKLFGVNELAVRFPTMIASFCTCLLLYWFLAYKVKKPLLGVMAVLVFVTSKGFFRVHVSRTGDYDALLVFFMLVSSILMYLFIEEEHRRVRNIYLFFLALTLAFMTKGIPSLIFLPAILIYAICRKRLMVLLRCKHIYIGAAAFLLIVTGYYLLREHYNPGYLEAVLYNDITGRYLHTDMQNGDDIAYYVRIMKEKTFYHWYFLFIPGILVGFLIKETQLRNLFLFASLLAVFHLLVVSKAQTKNEWYDAATYPFWAIIAAVLLYVLLQLLLSFKENVYLRMHMVPYVFLLGVFLLPYIEAIDNSIAPERYLGAFDNESMGLYLKSIYHDKKQKPDAYIAFDDPEGNIMWYMEVLRLENRPVPFKDFTKLNAGDKIMAYQPAVKKYIEQHYEVRRLDSMEAVRVYSIGNIKPADSLQTAPIAL